MSRETHEYWQRQMRAAASEDALLHIVSAYLATLPREAVASLPESSRPVQLARPDDIAALNVQLARDELMYSGEEKVASLLREMVTVLTEATHRLTQFSLEARLLGPPSQGRHSGS